MSLHLLDGLAGRLVSERIINLRCLKNTGGLTREQLDAELMKGVESMKSGKTYTADEVDAELRKAFGI